MFYQKELHAGRQKGQKMPSFVHGDLDLWPWPSNSSERGTKHVFHVNFRPNPFSGSGYILYTNKKPETVGAKNRTFHSSLPFTACGKYLCHLSSEVLFRNKWRKITEMEPAIPGSPGEKKTLKHRKADCLITSFTTLLMPSPRRHLCRQRTEGKWLSAETLLRIHFTQICT